MKHELRLLLKQRQVMLLLLVSMTLSWLSLQNGWQNMRHVQQQISADKQQAPLRQQALVTEFASHSASKSTALDTREIDAGDIGYYMFHEVYDAPAEWTFVAPGNRLVTPYLQRVRALGLQGQLYDGESHHPEYVMLGSFDYAFWLVFFSPLFAIALLHDLKASEFQAHRLLFLNSLLTRPVHFWLNRVVLRWGLVLLSLCLPLTLFMLMHHLSITPWLMLCGITFCYTGVWVALAAAFSLRNQALNANTNAMVLTSLWLVMTLLLPNLAQRWIEYRYPVVDGSTLALQHRQLVHRAWDQPKEATLQPFYQHYPQWKDSPAVTGRFHWKWYFAFQHMADVNLHAQVTTREFALQQRAKATANIGWLLPAVWAQTQLESVACSDVQHLLAQRHRIEAFHRQLREALYPFLFEERAFKIKDIPSLPVFLDKENNQPRCNTAATTT